MSEMVERVARALASEHSLDLAPDAMTYNMDNVLVPYWTLYVGDARAAIAAMREPTGAMRDAFWRAMFDAPPGEEGPVLIGAGLDAMIDAALSTKASEPDTAQPDRHTNGPALP